MAPATIVQLHRYADVIVDRSAASELVYEHQEGISQPKEQLQTEPAAVK